MQFNQRSLWCDRNVYFRQFPDQHWSISKYILTWYWLIQLQWNDSLTISDGFCGVASCLFPFLVDIFRALCDYCVAIKDLHFVLVIVTRSYQVTYISLPVPNAEGKECWRMFFCQWGYFYILRSTNKHSKLAGGHCTMSCFITYCEYYCSLFPPHSRINYDVACPMNFEKYPYDTQTCKVKYESCKLTTIHMNSSVNLLNSLTCSHEMKLLKFQWIVWCLNV